MQNVERIIVLIIAKKKVSKLIHLNTCNFESENKINLKINDRSGTLIFLYDIKGQCNFC